MVTVTSIEPAMEKTIAALALCSVAAALLIWPDGALRIAPVRSEVSRFRLRMPGMAVSGLLPAVLGGLLGGVLAGLAAGMFGATTAHLVRRQLVERAGAAEWTTLLAALRMLARDLRSGAPPVAAAAAAAAATDGPAGELLVDLSAAARLGVERALPARAGPSGQVAAQLRAGLRLSTRHGVPWAVLVDAIATDVADRVDATGLRAAQVAGPRFSGYVLAALPVFGLLMGAGMGADPLAVLFGPPPGAALLPVGVALACAGLLWSARIVAP